MTITAHSPPLRFPARRQRRTRRRLANVDGIFALANVVIASNWNLFVVGMRAFEVFAAVGWLASG